MRPISFGSAPRKPPLFKDDRGSKVLLGDKLVHELPGLTPDPAEHAALQSLSRRVRAIGRPVRIVTGITLMALGAAGPPVLVVMALRGGLGQIANERRGLVLTLLSPFIFGIPGWRLLKSRWGMRPAAVRRVILDAGRCPSCVHTLGTGAPAPDGCVVCTNCGAAWKP